MLIETRLRRIAADLKDLKAEFSDVFGKKDTGHLTTALDHVQCVLRDFNPEKHPKLSKKQGT